MADIFDILSVDKPSSPEKNSLDSIFSCELKKKKKKILDPTFKRPEGMRRELFALLPFGSNEVPPVFETLRPSGYKQKKANFGLRKVKKWIWNPFYNPARQDELVLHHWQKVSDEVQDYPFSQFNKIVEVPSYTDEEYAQLLQCESWSREETDHLFDLCRRFDLRFVIIHDRFNFSNYTKRSVENLKERYYNVRNQLLKARLPPGQVPKLMLFDADHERRRKEQLDKLYNRTPEQLEEEHMLLNELRKIEIRKREREKKTQDLQKLITAANSSKVRITERKRPKKKMPSQRRFRSEHISVEAAGIKFPEFKASGVSLQSQRMKLPPSVGQKKTKAIEDLMTKLGIDLNPFPCEEVCHSFNEMRSDMVLLYELKLAIAHCEFEAQTLSHQYEAMVKNSLDTAVSQSAAVSTKVQPEKSEPKSMLETPDSYEDAVAT